MKKKNLLLTAIAIFGLATITMAQVPSYVPTTGLVGWWPFNGNANDESGNGNHCTTFNNPTLSPDRFGNINCSYLLDGVNDWINTNSSFLQTKNRHSISIWWLTDSTKNNQTLFNTSPHTLENCAFHYSSVNPNPPFNIAYGLGNGAGSWNIMHPDNGQIPTPPTLNSWHNLIWVKDSLITGEPIWKFYFDTVLIHTFNSVTNIGNQLANIRFGAENNGFPTGGANFKGKLDDIGIWNRALNQQEIADLYNGCQLSVTTQPINQSVNISNNAQITTASSDPLAAYQWQTDLGVGFQNLNNVGQYSGTANDTLSIANTTLSNNNQPFRCIVSSGSCSDTSNVAILTVNNNVGINEFTQDNLFSVYPNPAKSQINVKADAKLLGSIYTVYDNTGKLVLTGKINSENTVIELGNLSGGIYLFSVGENLKQTFKVIKE